jgi:large subunit ribosomal protein L25
VKQQGGVLDIVHRQLELECLPSDIPEHIEIDVTEMMVGQSVRVRDVATNAKWKAVSDPEMMLMHVIIPKVEEVPATPEAVAAAAAAGPAEPEVIKKGKKDEEGEAVAAAPAPAAAKKEKK